MTKQTEAMEQALVDDEGENQAVRMFLALYGSQAGITTKQMRQHLEMAGFDGAWPEWADKEMHLTKAGAQLWIRHLFALAERPAQQEPVAYANDDWSEITFPLGKVPTKGGDLYTSPPAQPKPLTDWIDPNDKTQKQYLPHIGEPVLFCHGGKTYMGKHTCGSFQSEVTNQYFNTWECHWMYLPAAHSIKEQP